MFHDAGRGYLPAKRLNQFESWKNAENAKINARSDKPVRDEESLGVSESNLNRYKNLDTLVVGDESNLKYTLARCCNPMPGDDVFGFITIQEGIKVHRTNCPNAVELMSNYGYRIVKAIWKSQRELLFQVELEIIGNDRIGLVRDVTQVISSDMKVNISSIDLGITDEGIFEGKIKLYVRNKEHLDTLIEKITQIEGVESVKRCDSDT
ncbi:MAG: bifunctional (p)ppGpp synthetase/guanosine-3',5'-bis(diphosphate) 3'-pyrophosphohydrolase [Bacteroidia bacterium]|nr:bifunctional (p)ppGpp synthetase/guanosine-3',5'-bis(diphosphate) 3'-pyrophosphohydrolase [Bacteroidia bacterium]